MNRRGRAEPTVHARVQIIEPVIVLLDIDLLLRADAAEHGRDLLAALAELPISEVAG